jgi:hypothetical protein
MRRKIHTRLHSEANVIRNWQPVTGWNLCCPCHHNVVGYSAEAHIEELFQRGCFLESPIFPQ